MPTTLEYAERWFRAKKRPVGPRSLADAEAAFLARELVTAVAVAGGKPTAFVEFNGDYAGVGFLDENGREYLSYQFQQTGPGKLFLTMATHREFAPGSDAVSSASTYHFKPDGAVTRESEDFTRGTRSAVSQVADVSGNWSDYPKFGEFDALLRIERLGT